MEVRIVWQLIPWAPHSEGELVELVRDGGVDLAVIPSRAFDLAGIDDLEALQAPFVIDDAVQAADAIDLPAVTEALARLEGAGVAALGIALEGMRRPAAYDPDAPLLAASDFAGLGIRVPASHASEALFATLGAVPGLSDSVMRAADGTLLSAAETGYAWTGTLTDEPVITANMAFFPKYDLLVGSVERLEALDDDQRAALEAAARDAAGAFTAAMTDETAAAADFCTAGGSLAFASDEQLAGVRAAAQPALAALRERPQTAALIDAITAADTGATPALDIPRECLPPLGDGAGWPSP